MTTTGTWYPPSAGTGGFLLTNPPFALMTTTLTQPHQQSVPQPLPPFIGLWSPAPGCGKSTVAHYLGELQPGYMRVGFADPLRRMVTELLNAAGYPWHAAQRYVTWEKEEPLTRLPGAPTARDLLRKLGTEWGRDLIHPDLWVEVWASKASSRWRVVADDVRFPNEARRIIERGGEIWAITRPGYSDDSGHRSEAGLGDIPIARTIVNDGTLSELRRKVGVMA
jgi:hypothetical protein